jgi:TRAP-type C4-dicarboxylate transport system permease small subunit
VQAIQRIADRIVDAAMIVAEVAIAAMMLHITAEVLSRWIFRYGFDSVPEIVAYYYMAGLVFFSLAYVTRANGHIAAEIFTESLSPRPREILEGIIALLLCAFMLVVAWQTAVEAVSMTNSGELHQGATLLLPKWPARWFLPIGSGLMALSAFLIAVGKLRGMPAPGQPSEFKPMAHD